MLPIDSVEEFARQLRVHYDSRQAATATTATAADGRGSADATTARAAARKGGDAAAPSAAAVPPASSRVTSGQLAADLAAMQHAAAQLMHLPLMMGMMGAAAAAAPAAAAAAGPGMLPMMLPLGAELFAAGVPPPTFPAMMDPATAMLLSQQQQQQQQRGLRTPGGGPVPAGAPCPPGGVVAPTPPLSQLPPAQAKAARTRISDDQLAVLRAHFDINNSPSEEQIHAMSERTGLPPKVRGSKRRTVLSASTPDTCPHVGRNGRVVSASDCRVRGRRFESHRGQFCL